MEKDYEHKFAVFKTEQEFILEEIRNELKDVLINESTARMTLETTKEELEKEQ